MDPTEGLLGGAGSWSIKGFDYQVDVSVWLALDLMVATRLTSEMTLEHVSEEDVEADIDEPSPVADAVPMRGYRLIVQAKRRTGNAWTAAKFGALLDHGKQRKSARRRLAEDPNARYLLVTSAALNDPVRHLGVRRAGSWPTQESTSKALARKVHDLGGRIAVIAGQDDERLTNDIKTLLLEGFRVPRSRWEECLDTLRKAAWDRMRGAGGGRWTRNEVERVLGEHEGYLVNASESDDYVRPTNWGDLKQALHNQHALMIVGQSGSGKTATSAALWRAFKLEIPDLKRIHITHGPDQLRTDTTLPPVLYEIEDPWGRFRFEPDSRPWNDQLATAFRRARHDRLFVATSRTDIAHSSNALDSVQRWRMPLDAENYGPRERRKLYRNLSKGLPTEHAAFVHEREAFVLGQLGLPLEIRKFFDAVSDLDGDELAENPQRALSVSIQRAHQDSIERTVVEQIEARDAVKSAAILWALIKPHGRLSADVLRSLEDPLTDADSTLEGKIGQLVSSFVAARNFRQGGDGSLSYYHSKVEAGLETVLARHPQKVRRSLRALVDALIARDTEVGAAGCWGTETAAEIVQLAGRLLQEKLRLTPTSEARIDKWLEDKLIAGGRDLDKALGLAAAVGSDRSDLSELARWLSHRPESTFEFFTTWGKPDRGEEWYRRMRQSAPVRSLACSFVREVLPVSQMNFPKSFALELTAVAGDLTEAFLEAAQRAVSHNLMDNDDVIAAGALEDLDRFEAVVDVAVDARKSTPAQKAEFEHDRLQIINAEVSDDYAEHMADHDDGYTAGEFLQAYVARVRAKRGWQSLLVHRHAETLSYFWLRDILHRTGPKPTVGELQGTVDAAYGTSTEDWLWDVLSKHWDERFSDVLMDRIVEGHASVEIRRAGISCFAERLSEQMPLLVSRLDGGAGNVRLAQLAIELVDCANTFRDGSETQRANARLMLKALPEPFQRLAEAEQAILEDRPPILSAQTLATLVKLDDPPENVRAMRIRLANHFDLNVAADVNWILDNSDDNDNAVDAIEVAIIRGMTSVLVSALDHKFAHVAAKALTAIADPLPAPLGDPILSCVNRISSPVRKALLAQLTAKPHRDHLGALWLLVGDEWSKSAPRENDDSDYPIARGAVEVITALSEVPDDVLVDFIKRARSTEDRPLIRLLLICVLRHGSQARQADVVAMSRKGRRIAVGRAAALALYAEFGSLLPATVALITPPMITTLPALIAGPLLITTALRGSLETIDAITEALVASDDRKVFLCILAKTLADRDAERAMAIAARLPDGHPARRWAESTEDDVAISREQLIDLGDAAAVREVCGWARA